jgi:hypothetical protein
MGGRRDHDSVGGGTRPGGGDKPDESEGLSYG